MRIAAELSAGSHQCAFDGAENGEEPKKNVARGEERREGVSCAPGTPQGRSRIEEAFLEGEARHYVCLGVCLRYARTLDPPETRSPDCTLISHSGPKKISTREPNFMSPTRSPLATVSPGFL